MCHLTYIFNYYCITDYNVSSEIDDCLELTRLTNLESVSQRRRKLTSILNNFACLSCQNIVFPQELVEYVVVNPLLFVDVSFVSHDAKLHPTQEDIVMLCNLLAS